jgi:hypothetical protein
MVVDNGGERGLDEVVEELVRLTQAQASPASGSA